MSGCTAEEIADARAWLSKKDPILKRVHKLIPEIEWHEKPYGFQGLVMLIVEQQVSTASAAAIWKKLKTGLKTVNVRNVLALSETQLRQFGLSGQKAHYIRSVAEAVDKRTLNFKGLDKLEDDLAVERLMELKGVGRWTAEAYLMGSVGRTNFFPAGDLALQEGFRLAEGASKRLNQGELYERAERWKPNRGVAALMLWKFYTECKAGRIEPKWFG
jgi:DNA-3-methyladenine glycosylase II